MERNCNRLCIMAFGLAVGIIWMAGIVIMGIAADFSTSSGYGMLFVNLIKNIYPGYGVSLQGIIIGGVWALIDGFFAGVFIAWFYNMFASCCSKCNKPE